MSTKPSLPGILPFHFGTREFNYDLAIDWAIQLIEQGNESDNVLMLASFSKPASAVEIRPYLGNVLRDLNIEEPEGDAATIALIACYLREILAGRATRQNLAEVFKLFVEKDGLRAQDEFALSNFYLLHHAWDSLEQHGEQHYFLNADLSTIESLVKQHAQTWLVEHAPQHSPPTPATARPAYITYCSAKKRDDAGLLPASERYQSKRIDAVATAAAKAGCAMLILSGSYGVLEPTTAIPYYNHLLVSAEVAAHAQKVAQQLKELTIGKVIFYSAPLALDANVEPYLRCMELACQEAEVVLEFVYTEQAD